VQSLRRVEGKQLNSPNDVVVKSDGSVWFTDPPFGILSNYEGGKATPELPTNVYRIDPRSGRATLVAGDIDGPNGLCFSPDEKLMYIVESRARPRAIRVFDVVDDGARLANGRLFGDVGDGSPDGFRCDVHGNLWCGWGTGAGLDGVVVFAPDGKMIGRIALPERCAQPLFRRDQAQPPVPGGEPVALRRLCEHRRRARRLNCSAAACSSGPRRLFRRRRRPSVRIDDRQRVAFLRDHIAVRHRAIAEKVNLRVLLRLDSSAGAHAARWLASR
jgi:hypothetical protein